MRWTAAAAGALAAHAAVLGALWDIRTAQLPRTTRIEFAVSLAAEPASPPAPPPVVAAPAAVPPPVSDPAPPPVPEPAPASLPEAPRAQPVRRAQPHVVRPSQAEPRAAEPRLEAPPAPDGRPLAAPPPQAPPASPAADPTAVPAWQGRLVGQLQRAQRYPESAREAGEEGVALVSFTMDRAGHVLSVRLVRSSGTPALDEEASALVPRVEPLPSPPAEMPGSTITLTVPIRFSLR